MVSLESVPDHRWLRADRIGTAVFVACAVAVVVSPEGLGWPILVVSMVLFAVGLVTFLWAFLIAVDRSRTERIAAPQIYLLHAGCAPASVRNAFAALLAVQVVVGLVAAAARPFTVAAFGLLVPMFGLGLSGMWGARNAAFPDRVDATEE